jgi:hypothetical protein
MLQVLAALGTAHEQGIIHRDIKSANIMVLDRVDDDGEPIEHIKVCDFGLAKILDHDSRVDLGGTTQGGTVVGTPAYMSPEQAVGDTVDAKTDVYAAGVAMFEMLTGRVPFRGETPMAILVKQIKDEPPSPRSIVPSIPPAIEAIVLRALNKEREDRPTARELRKSIGDVLKNPPKPGKEAPPPKAAKPVPKPKAPEPEPASVDLHEEMPLPPRRAARDTVEELPLDAILGAPILGKPVAAPGTPTTDDLLELVNEAVEEIEIEGADRDRDRDRGSRPMGERPKRAEPELEHQREIFQTYGIHLKRYAGSHGIWVRDPDERTLGPLDYKDSLQLLKKVAERGKGDRLWLSDGKVWMNATKFVKLTGQQAVLRRPPLPDPRGQLYGSLVDTPLPALCAAITREQLTGRIYFKHDNGAEDGRLEIHLVNGAPTFVLSDLLELGLPSMLVSKGLVAEPMLPKLIVDVIGTEKPLAEICAHEGIDVGKHLSLFMRENLAELVRWRGQGTFSFDATVMPGSVKPLAPSMFSVIPELVYRTSALHELIHAISQWAETPLPRSDHFDEMLKALNLSRQNATIASRFGAPRTIAQTLGGSYENKLHLTIAYILVESDMLLRPL